MQHFTTDENSTNINEAHKLKENTQGNYRQPPWEVSNTPAPWDNLDPETSENFKETYKLHQDFILDTDKISDIVSIYNIPVDNTLSISTVINKIKQIYHSANYAFLDLILAFGLILQNIETKHIQIFHPIQKYRSLTRTRIHFQIYRHYQTTRTIRTTRPHNLSIQTTREHKT